MMYSPAEYENYKLQLELLQEKFQRSEENRQQLQKQLEKILQKRNEQDKYIKAKTKQRMQEFLDEQNQRKERNKMLLEMLERIDQQTATMAARSEKLKMMKLQYEMYFAKLVQNQTKRLMQSSATSVIPNQIPILLPSEAKTIPGEGITLDSSTPIKATTYHLAESSGQEGNHNASKPPGTSLSSSVLPIGSTTYCLTSNLKNNQSFSETLDGIAPLRHWTLAMATPLVDGSGMLLTNAPRAPVTNNTSDYMHFIPLNVSHTQLQYQYQQPQQQQHQHPYQNPYHQQQVEEKMQENDFKQHTSQSKQDNDVNDNLTKINYFNYNNKNNNNNNSPSNTSYGSARYNTNINGYPDESRKVAKSIGGGSEQALDEEIAAPGRMSNYGDDMLVGGKDLLKSQYDATFQQRMLRESPPTQDLMEKATDINSKKVNFKVINDEETADDEIASKEASSLTKVLSSLPTSISETSKPKATATPIGGGEGAATGTGTISGAGAGAPSSSSSKSLLKDIKNQYQVSAAPTVDSKETSLSERIEDFTASWRDVSYESMKSKLKPQSLENNNEPYAGATSLLPPFNTNNASPNDNDEQQESNKVWHSQQSNEFQGKSWLTNAEAKDFQNEFSNKNQNESISSQEQQPPSRMLLSSDNHLNDNIFTSSSELPKAENKSLPSGSLGPLGPLAATNGSKDAFVPKKQVSIENIENAIYGELVHPNVAPNDKKEAPELITNLVSLPEQKPDPSDQQQDLVAKTEIPEGELNNYPPYLSGTADDTTVSSSITDSYDPTYATIESTTNAQIHNPNVNQSEQPALENDYANVDYSNYDPNQYNANYDPNAYPGYVYDEATGQYVADPNQQYPVEGSYDQQQYDPSQQQYDAMQQQQYDGSQQQYDAPQEPYDANQQQYGSEQGQYDPNQPAYDADQQNYDPNTQPYDPNQQYAQQYEASPAYGQETEAGEKTNYDYSAYNVGDGSIPEPQEPVLEKQAPENIENLVKEDNASAKESSKAEPEPVAPAVATVPPKVVKPTSILASSSEKNAATADTQKKKKKVNFVDSSESEESATSKVKAAGKNAAGGTTSSESDFDFSGSEAAAPSKK